MLTESVYLDVVSPDGRTGFVARLARHVDEGVGWLWLHVFTDGAIFAFARDDLPLAGRPTVETGEGAVYELESDVGSAIFARAGDPTAPSGATVTVKLPSKGVRLEATFTPTGHAGSNLPGRTEVLGRVDATVVTATGEHRMIGLGQFHEQHQTTPRFRVPFTYGTLRGERLGLVFLVGPRASTAFVRDDDGVAVATAVRIEPVGGERTLELDVGRKDPLRLQLTRTHHYLLPIGGHPRESSLVVASTGPETLSGCVNDWEPRR